MIGSKTHWECQHYGFIIHDIPIKIESHHIRIKIYRFDYHLYIEVWENGYVILFHELMD